MILLLRNKCLLLPFFISFHKKKILKLILHTKKIKQIVIKNKFQNLLVCYIVNKIKKVVSINVKFKSKEKKNAVNKIKIKLDYLLFEDI